MKRKIKLECDRDRSALNNSENSLVDAIEQKKWKLAEEIISSKNDIRYNNLKNIGLLHLVVRYGNKKIFFILVDKGLDLFEKNGKNITLLHWSVLGGNMKIILFLKEQYDENIIVENGIDFLEWAARGGYFHVFMYFFNLLNTEKHKIRKNKKFCNMLPHAIMGGNLNIFKFLLEMGVKPFIDKTSGMEITLILCCALNEMNMAKILLEEGANPSAKNSKGETAFDYANTDIEELLFQYLPK